MLLACRDDLGKPRRVLTDTYTLEESWGQHRETESEIEAKEAEEIRLAEEEHAAQQLINNQVHPRSLVLSRRIFLPCL